MSNPNDDDNKILVDKEELANLAKEAEDKQKLSEEIRELRSKKNEEIEALKKQLSQDGKSEVNIDEKIDEVLSKKEQEQSKKEKEEAILEFRESLSEFSSDNDPGDLKFKAFQKELNKFNFADVKNKNEMNKRLKEVYEFVNRKTNKEEDDNGQSPYAFTRKNGGNHSESSNDSLSDKEKRLIKTYGFTDEYFIEQKKKRPYYINNLLKFMN
jgi:DNA repair exonuclease SbcCD ATPase subunit